MMSTQASRFFPPHSHTKLCVCEYSLPPTLAWFWGLSFSTVQAFNLLCLACLDFEISREGADFSPVPDRYCLGHLSCTTLPLVTEFSVIYSFESQYLWIYLSRIMLAYHCCKSVNYRSVDLVDVMCNWLNQHPIYLWDSDRSVVAFWWFLSG